MKLSYFQLEQHLAKPLHKVYIVGGEEPFLVQETLSLIRQKAMTFAFKDRVRLDIETDEDLTRSYSHAYTPPLLHAQRLLELHWKCKLTPAAHQFLRDYAARPSAHTLLLVRLEKLDSKTEQTQWFKALEKNSVVIPLWPLPQNQLLSWIMERAKKQNVHLTTDALQLLAHYVEGNMQAAAQEIEKLSLWGSDVIDGDTIKEIVMEQGCFNAFDLVENMLAGNTAQALRILRYLQNEGTEPVMILGALTFELRTAAKIAKELKKGGSLTILFSQYRIRPGRQISLRHFFKRCHEQDCHQLLLKAGEIDRMIKGALPGDPWGALECFSLQAAGIPII